MDRFTLRIISIGLKPLTVGFCGIAMKDATQLEPQDSPKFPKVFVWSRMENIQTGEFL